MVLAQIQVLQRHKTWVTSRPTPARRCYVDVHRPQFTARFTSLVVYGAAACVSIPSPLHDYLVTRQCQTCTLWQNSVAEQCGRTVWQHSVAEQRGSTAWQHSVAAQRGSTAWQNSVAEQAWQNSVAEHSGRTQWQNTVAEHSGKTTHPIDVRSPQNIGGHYVITYLQYDEGLYTEQEQMSCPCGGLQ